MGWRTACLFILFVASCSSSQREGTTGPSSCNRVVGDPDCSGELEYACTGNGAATDLQQQIGTGCNGGTPGKNGATIYCCSGCDLNAGPTCPPAAAGVTWVGHTCSAGSPVPAGCASLPAGPRGEVNNCCLSSTGTPLQDQNLDQCIVAPTYDHGSCSSLYVECPGVQGVRPPPKGFTCVDDGAGSNLPTFCCSGPSEPNDTCAPTSSMMCQRSAKAYACDGAKRPEDLDPTLACSALGLVDQTQPSIEYCCIPFTKGACTPDSTVPGCLNQVLFGFSCTGNAKPSDAAASLTCVSQGSSGSTTSYCCED